MLSTLGAAGAMLLDNTGIFSLGMHVVGAPFQKRENAVAVLSADTMPKFFVPWNAASGVGKGEKREHINILGSRLTV